MDTTLSTEETNIPVTKSAKLTKFDLNIPEIDPEVRQEHRVDWTDWRVWLGGFLALVIMCAAYPFVFYDRKYWGKSFIQMICFVRDRGEY